MSKGFKSFMKQHKTVLLAHVVSLGIIFLGFLLCRFVFFELHGMKEWPLDLLIAGVVVLGISLLAKKKYFPWFVSGGYYIGFWLGVIFHTEGFDPGGGRTDNLWQIWTVVFAVCILAGVIFEIAMKWRKLLYNRRKSL